MSLQKSLIIVFTSLVIVLPSSVYSQECSIVSSIASTIGDGGTDSNEEEEGNAPPGKSDANIKYVDARIQGTDSSSWSSTLDIIEGQHWAMRVISNNKGDIDYTDADIEYYVHTSIDFQDLDSRHVIDRHGEEVEAEEIGTLSKDGTKVTEYKQHLRTPELAPGVQKQTFYAYACVDSDEIDDEDEYDEDNNCSKESDREEYVEVNVTRNLTGYLDGRTSDCGYFFGWARDADLNTEAQGLDIEIWTRPVYSTGNYTRRDGGAVKTGLARPDAGGNFGWEWTIPKELKGLGAHEFIARAKNYGGNYADLDLPSRANANIIHCPPETDQVKSLFRAYNPGTTTHFMSPDSQWDGTEGDVIIGNPDWQYEGFAGYVFVEQVENSSSIIRFVRPDGDVGHFYAIANSQDYQNAMNDDDWYREGHVFYVYQTPQDFTVPMYRLTRPVADSPQGESRLGYFYTFNKEERDLAQSVHGFSLEGEVFHVYRQIPPEPKEPDLVPSLLPEAVDVFLATGTGHDGDKITDRTEIFGSGQDVHLQVDGDVSGGHGWKIVVYYNDEVIDELYSGYNDANFRSVYATSFTPENDGSYGIEALVDADGKGYISKAFTRIEVLPETTEGGTGSCSIATNATFNTGTENWNNESWGSSSRTITQSSDAYEGSGSAKIDVTSYTNGQVKFVSDSIDVDPSTTYHIGTFAKGSVSNVVMQTVITNSDGTTDYRGWTNMASVNSNWQEFNNSFTTTANAQYMKLYFTAESAGDLYIDDVWIGTETRNTDCSNTGGDPGGGTDPVNLMPNGDFTNSIAGWHEDSWNTTATFTHVAQSEIFVNLHHAFINVTAVNSGGDAKWRGDHVDIEPSTVYHIGSQYESDVSTQISLEVELTDGSKIYPYLGGVPASTTWAIADFTYETPANAKSVSFRHIIKDVGYLRTDNIWLSTESRP